MHTHTNTHTHTHTDVLLLINLIDLLTECLCNPTPPTPTRLNPKNSHQRPTVVLLCGPHVQGAQGVSCGRHLANHEVEVILFLPNFVKIQEALTHELSLFGRAWGRQVSGIRGTAEVTEPLVSVQSESSMMAL